jgi:organic hydroperoxide reductase OsmC/OhrA
MDEREFELTLKQRDTFEFAVTFNGLGEAQLTMDEPPPLGEGRGPNAARILGAAIGHCLSASLLFCLKKTRVEVSAMETKVTGTVERNEKGRLRIGTIRVQLSPEIAREDRVRIGRCLEMFEDYCIVTQSVRKGIEVDVQVAEEATSAT